MLPYAMINIASNTLHIEAWTSSQMTFTNAFMIKSSLRFVNNVSVFNMSALSQEMVWMSQISYSELNDSEPRENGVNKCNCCVSLYINKIMQWYISTPWLHPKTSM